MQLRDYTPADGPATLALFLRTVREVNRRDYDPVQIAAWASTEIDPQAWSDRFTGRYAPIAEISGELAGFAELDRDGHIDRFYVSADFQRRGIGRALLGALLRQAGAWGLGNVWADVSLTALPFFTKQGFAVIRQQTVTLRGVEFVNMRMERSC